MVSDSTDFVHRHIEELGLFVKVLWVGPNLRRVKDEWTEKQAKKKKSLVILARAPSDVIVQEDQYDIVTFPPCEKMNSTKSEQNSSECVYDVQRVVKVAWKYLQVAAPPAWMVRMEAQAPLKRRANENCQKFKILKNAHVLKAIHTRCPL